MTDFEDINDKKEAGACGVESLGGNVCGEQTLSENVNAGVVDGVKGMSEEENVQSVGTVDDKSDGAVDGGVIDKAVVVKNPGGGRTFEQNPLLFKKKERNASFELLRILCMIFIIFHHFWLHGGWKDMTGANYVIGRIIQCLFMPSVNLFVMLSAYFMCSGKDTTVRWKKVGKIWIQTFFYSIVIYALFYGLKVCEFEPWGLVSSIFPVLSGKYWFVSSYVIMMIASPFLNVLLNNISKRTHLLICAIIIALAAIQDLKGFGGTMLPLNGGYDGLWFCLLYILAAYIRKYDISLNKVSGIVSAIAYVAMIVIAYFASGKYTSLHVIIESYIVFLAFKSFKIRRKIPSKIINFVSALTFGVYLIHDSPELRGWMYGNLFHNYEFVGHKLGSLILIGFVLLTFAVCAAIDFVRAQAFKGVGWIAKKALQKKKHL